jgi:hypothetical protein|uniref:Uncharacterized protein n=1 Tax=Picea glauca TaxID=3330 RepID=A0A117NGF8_PICGL|nr:hypothetical protein ABT39_MTgene1393 [Picea glauca]QHR89453.1 hypothetical protein Q903MT_gene3474 [Picea sitchensis]
MKTEAGSNVFVFSHLASFLIKKHTQVFIPAATLWAVRLDPKRSLTASSSKSQRGVRDLREMGNSVGKVMVIKVGKEAK